MIKLKVDDKLNGKEVKVSVIIPVYNAEKYLRQCMDSIICQSLEDIQIICVDDGSTDTSPEILRYYQNIDDRIQIITQKNQYAGVARNNGLKFARGKYVMFWDSDDFFEKNALEELYNRAEDTGADIVVCNSYAYDDEFRCDMDWGLSVDEDSIPCKGVFPARSCADRLFQIFVASCWDKLFRRSFIDDNGLKYRDSRVAEDINFVFIGLCLSDKISFINKKLIHYRKFNDNSLENSKAGSWQYTISMFDDFYDELCKRELIDSYKRSFDNFIIDHFSAVLSMLGDYDAYIDMCNILKDRVIVRYGLDKRNKPYFFSEYLYNRMQKLISCSPQEYLMYDLAQRRNYEERNYIQYQTLNKGDIKYYNDEIGRLTYLLRHKKWYFPYNAVPQDSDVILYGAGDVGRDYYIQITESGYCNIVLWADRNYKKLSMEGLPVESCDKIATADYQFIIVATVEKDIYASIVRNLTNMGADIEKIIWCGDN